MSPKAALPVWFSSFLSFNSVKFQNSNLHIPLRRQNAAFLSLVLMSTDKPPQPWASLVVSYVHRIGNIMETLEI